MFVMTGERGPNGRTRQAVARLYAQGLGGAAIARQLGISKPTVCFHLRMLGVPPSVEFAARYDWDQIRAYYESGHSMTEYMSEFGFSRNAWWDAIRRGVISPRPRLEPISQILRNGRRRNRYHVKTRLIAAGLKRPGVNIAAWPSGATSRWRWSCTTSTATALTTD